MSPRAGGGSHAQQQPRDADPLLVRQRRRHRQRGQYGATTRPLPPQRQHPHPCAGRWRCGPLEWAGLACQQWFGGTLTRGWALAGQLLALWAIRGHDGRCEQHDRCWRCVPDFKSRDRHFLLLLTSSIVYLNIVLAEQCCSEVCHS